MNSGVPQVEIGISDSSARSFARPKSIILILRSSFSSLVNTMLLGFRSIYNEGTVTGLGLEARNNHTSPRWMILIWSRNCSAWTSWTRVHNAWKHTQYPACCLPALSESGQCSRKEDNPCKKFSGTTPHLNGILNFNTLRREIHFWLKLSFNFFTFSHATSKFLASIQVILKFDAMPRKVSSLFSLY